MELVRVVALGMWCEECRVQGGEWRVESGEFAGVVLLGKSSGDWCWIGSWRWGCGVWRGCCWSWESEE